MVQKVISMPTNNEVPIDRIRKNIGGYLFVDTPLATDVLKKNLVTHCEARGIHITEPQDANAYENRSSFSWNGISGELGVTQQDGYILVSVMFQKSSLADSDKLGIQSVREFWTSLCEASDCSFGYFTQYPEQTTTAYRHNVIEDIDTYSAGDLMDKGFWMSYFNQNFLPLGPTVSSMPSGAWTVGGHDHPITGSSESDHVKG